MRLSRLFACATGDGVDRWPDPAPGSARQRTPVVPGPPDLACPSCQSRWCGTTIVGCLRRVTPGYRARTTAIARAPPMTWAAMNAGAEDGRDAGEGVGEHPADGDRRIGEAGRGGEEVRGADVGADSGRGGPAAAAAGEREDHQDQAESGDDLRQEVRGRGPVLDGDAHRRKGEHQVRRDRAADAARHLRGQVGGSVPPAQPAERGVHERHDRVEVAAGHRPEHQDDREQPGRGRCRVLQQLQPRVARRQPLRRRCPSRSPPRPGTRCRAARPAAAATAPRQSPHGTGLVDARRLTAAHAVLARAIIHCLHRWTSIQMPPACQPG